VDSAASHQAQDAVAAAAAEAGAGEAQGGIVVAAEEAPTSR
jgi:hypothetical protein